MSTVVRLRWKWMAVANILAYIDVAICNMFIVQATVITIVNYNCKTFTVQVTGWKKRVDSETKISFGWKKWRYDIRYNDIKQIEASLSSFSGNLFWYIDILSLLVPVARLEPTILGLLAMWVENSLTNIHIFCTDICISRPLTSWYYADSIDTDVCIQMFADVRWVGFLPPYFLLAQR